MEEYMSKHKKSGNSQIVERVFDSIHLIKSTDLSLKEAAKKKEDTSPISSRW